MTWKTIGSHGTRFEAEMMVGHLHDAGLDARIVSDSGGETLPHVAFGTGGHRVQVAAADEAEARRVAGEIADPVDTGESTSGTPSGRRVLAAVVITVVALSVLVGLQSILT